MWRRETKRRQLEKAPATAGRPRGGGYGRPFGRGRACLALLSTQSRIMRSCAGSPPCRRARPSLAADVRRGWRSSLRLREPLRGAESDRELGPKPLRYEGLASEGDDLSGLQSGTGHGPGQFLLAGPARPGANSFARQHRVPLTESRFLLRRGSCRTRHRGEKLHLRSLRNVQDTPHSGEPSGANAAQSSILHGRMRPSPSARPSEATSRTTSAKSSADGCRDSSIRGST